MPGGSLNLQEVRREREVGIKKPSPDGEGCAEEPGHRSVRTKVSARGRIPGARFVRLNYPCDQLPRATDWLSAGEQCPADPVEL